MVAGRAREIAREGIVERACHRLQGGEEREFSNRLQVALVARRHEDVAVAPILTQDFRAGRQPDVGLPIRHRGIGILGPEPILRRVVETRIDGVEREPRSGLAHVGALKERLPRRLVGERLHREGRIVFERHERTVPPRKRLKLALQIGVARAKPVVIVREARRHQINRVAILVLHAHPNGDIGAEFRLVGEFRPVLAAFAMVHLEFLLRDEDLFVVSARSLLAETLSQAVLVVKVEFRVRLRAVHRLLVENLRLNGRPDVRV